MNWSYGEISIHRARCFPVHPFLAVNTAVVPVLSIEKKIRIQVKPSRGNHYSFHLLLCDFPPSIKTMTKHMQESTVAFGIIPTAISVLSSTDLLGRSILCKCTRLTQLVVCSTSCSLNDLFRLHPKYYCNNLLSSCVNVKQSLERMLF